MEPFLHIGDMIYPHIIYIIYSAAKKNKQVDKLNLNDKQRLTNLPFSYTPD